MSEETKYKVKQLVMVNPDLKELRLTGQDPYGINEEMIKLQGKLAKIVGARKLSGGKTAYDIEYKINEKLMHSGWTWSDLSLVPCALSEEEALEMLVKGEIDTPTYEELVKHV